MKSKGRGKSNRAVGIGMYEKDWQAEGDCDTLIRAEEIKRDPKRLKRAQEIAHERLQAAARVTAEQPVGGGKK